jgi:thiamine pyrophosphate-dependent acetolactate synthase large subunit-like protein
LRPWQSPFHQRPLEANRNRAPVILIATQIVRRDLGFESIQEIDYNDVFKGCSIYCEMIAILEQACRKTVAACQAALTKRGVAVLVVPADIVNASHDEAPYAVHMRGARLFARVTQTSMSQRQDPVAAVSRETKTAPAAFVRCSLSGAAISIPD